jgi:phosphotransferase system HPr (HPr) family protein
MVVREVLVANQSGLQSKAAAIFIQKASNFKSSIWIEKDERKANAKSLLGLLSLGIGSGMKVSVIAEGMDEEEAIEELESYLKTDSAENI